MQLEKKTARRIHLLRDSVAQKIAAGEVIDRPFSVVRELLDNSIDSGADSIDLYIEGGGIRRIRVLDNGSGMSREDLELCYKPHATSKISAVGDIYNLHTLGFRGEALASIAACAKLTVTSAPEDSEPHTLEVRNGTPIRLELSRGTQGTVVDVADLFFAMPGRRKFLKSAGAETAACKRTLLEKALPFPSISFRLYTDNQLKLFLPASDLQERIVQAYPGQINPQFLNHVEDEAGRFKIKAVLASPAVQRRDRRNIQVYVNRRRIQEYSLVQAVHYAYEELLPGGVFPVAFIFLDIDPELVDFNIHPAKREVKIKNLPDIHHQLVHSLKEHLNRKYSVPERYHQPPAREPRMDFGPTPAPSPQTPTTPQSPYSGPPARPATDRPYTVPVEQWKQLGQPETAAETGQQERIEYIGQVFDLFLIVRRGESLYMIDQHAAHERIIFEQLTNGAVQSQNLLVPYEFEVEEDVETLLTQRGEEYRQIGIHIEQVHSGRWRINRVPARFTGLEEELVESLSTQEASETAFKAQLFADLACKAAVKDGERFDRYSGEELARQAFALRVPRCPHGRPIWFQISREELFEVVGRT
jgi:DNA mismatch repair protein MutL